MQIIPLTHNPSNGKIERFLVEINMGGKRIGNHEVARYVTSAWAAKNYQEINIVVDLSMPPCGIASNIDFESSVAGSFCAACTAGNHCRSIAQYQDYITILDLDISTANYTEEDFIAILNKIDQLFIQQLELSGT